MTDEKVIFKEWQKKQKEKADKVFLNPITGELDEENSVTYLHKLYIGGSVDSSLLGLNPYRSIKDEYDNMNCFKLQDDLFVFRRGHYLERFVAKEFSLVAHKVVTTGVTLFSEKYPWAMAQIDFRLRDDTPLEIKVCSVNPNEDDGTKGFGKGCEFNDKGDLVYTDDTVPTYYMVQCQKQLFLSEKSFMWLAVWLTYEDKIRVYYIERNDEIIEHILKAEHDFLFNHVIPQIPYSEDKKELKTVDEMPNVCYADDPFISLVREYNELSQKKNELEKKVEALSDTIREYIGVHDEAVDNNGRVVIKQTPQSRTSLDINLLKNDYANIYTKCKKTKLVKSKLTVNKKYFNN